MMLSILNRWFAQLATDYADRVVRRRSRRESLCAKTLCAEIQTLEARQLLSGPALNIGPNHQGNFNIFLDGAASTVAGGNFGQVSPTLTNPSQTATLPFAYCIHIEEQISINTTYPSTTTFSTNVNNSANPPSGNPAQPGYVLAKPDLPAVNLNAIALLANQIGPTVGDVNLDGEHYFAGLALQAAIWDAEYEAPTSSGWSTNPFATGVNYSLLSISPLKFSGTPLSDFVNAYQAA